MQGSETVHGSAWLRIHCNCQFLTSCSAEQIERGRNSDSGTVFRKKKTNQQHQASQQEKKNQPECSWLGTTSSRGQHQATLKNCHHKAMPLWT